MRKAAVARRCKEERRCGAKRSVDEAAESEVKLQDLEALEFAMLQLGEQGEYAAAAEIRDKLAVQSLEEELQVLNAHRKFYEAFTSCDLDCMEKLWWKSNNVYLLQPALQAQGVAGHANVRKAWADIFETKFRFSVEPEHIQVSVWGCTAVVTNAEVFAFDRAHNLMPCYATNIFRKVNGQWLMAHRHVSQEMDSVSEDPVPATSSSTEDPVPPLTVLDYHVANQVARFELADGFECEAPLETLKWNIRGEATANFDKVARFELADGSECEAPLETLIWKIDGETHQWDQNGEPCQTGQKVADKAVAHNVLRETDRALQKLSNLGLLPQADRLSLLSDIISADSPLDAVAVKVWMAYFQGENVNQSTWEHFGEVMRYEATILNSQGAKAEEGEGGLGS